MTTKDEALAEIVDIARRHNVGLMDITQAMSADKPPSRKSEIMMKVFAYLGGIFILAGASVYVSMFWEDMNSAMRIIITLGTGLVLYILALVASKEARYEKAIIPLFLLAALFQPTGLLVAIDELFHRGSDWRYATLFTFAVMLIQQGLTFWQTRRGTLLFTTLVFGCFFFVNAADLLHIDGEFVSLVLGLSLLCIAYGLDKTPYQVLTGMLYFAGSIMFLWGAFDILEGTIIELLYLGITCLLIYVSTVTRSKTLLVVATCAMLGYIGYFTSEHFVNSIGWPLALVVMGLIFIAVSASAFKIGKKYLDS